MIQKQPEAFTAATSRHPDHTSMKQHHQAFWHSATILCQHSSQCAADTTTEHIQLDRIEPLLLPPAEQYPVADHPGLAAHADSHELMHWYSQAVSQYYQLQCSCCDSNPTTINISTRNQQSHSNKQ